MSDKNKCNDDKLYQIMKDVSINRKKEIVDDVAQSKSICELVDVSRNSFINPPSALRLGTSSAGRGRAKR